MGKRCSFVNCSSDYRYPAKLQGATFFPIPKPKTKLELCMKWVEACNRNNFSVDNVTKNSYICSKHFVGGAPSVQYPIPMSEDTVKEIYNSLDDPSSLIMLPLHKISTVSTAKKSATSIQFSSNLGPQPDSQLIKVPVVPVITLSNMISGYIILNPRGKSSSEVKTSSQQFNGISSHDSLLADSVSRPHCEKKCSTTGTSKPFQISTIPSHDSTSADSVSKPQCKKKCSTTLELHHQISTIPAGWIYSYDGNKIAFSKEENNVKQLSVVILESLQVTVKVFNQTLNSVHPVVEFVPATIDSLESLNTALSIFSVWKICPGNNDKKFQICLGRSKFKGGHYIDESKSFHSKSCAIVFLPTQSNSKICRNCQTFRQILRLRTCSTLKRKRLELEMETSTNLEFSSLKSNCSKLKFSRARSHDMLKKSKYRKQELQKNISELDLNLTEVDGEICYLVEVINSP